MTTTPDTSSLRTRGNTPVNPSQIDVDDVRSGGDDLPGVPASANTPWFGDTGGLPLGDPVDVQENEEIDDLDDFEDVDEYDDLDDLDIELVVFDMAGTTVQDNGLVERAFVLAAQRSGIAPTEAALEEALEYVRETMGQSKIEVFRELADSESEALAANDAFEVAYGDLITRVGVTGIDGAEDLFQELRDAGVKIALTTGFSRATQDALIESLGWADLIDLSLSPAEAGRGRPHPDLPLTALLRMGVSSVAAMVVVGDTASDMLSGLRAGAGLVVGVRTGAHDTETLEAAGADLVIDSVAHLAELLGLRDESIR